MRTVLSYSAVYWAVIWANDCSIRNCHIYASSHCFLSQCLQLCDRRIEVSDKLAHSFHHAKQIYTQSLSQNSLASLKNSMSDLTTVLWTRRLGRCLSLYEWLRSSYEEDNLILKDETRSCYCKTSIAFLYDYGRIFVTWDSFMQAIHLTSCREVAGPISTPSPDYAYNHHRGTVHIGHSGGKRIPYFTGIIGSRCSYTEHTVNK